MACLNEKMLPSYSNVNCKNQLGYKDILTVNVIFKKFYLWKIIVTLICSTDKELKDLKVALKLLSGGDTKTLAKMYHINTASQNKMDITDLLMKKTKQNTIGSMFKVAGNSPETLMLNR